MPKLGAIFATLSLVLSTALAQPAERIDVQRPDAPELAAYGEYAIGVRTIDVVDEDRLNILGATEGEEIPRYDRPLTLEVWYPAVLEEGATGGGTFTFITRGGTASELAGRAVRDATPNVEAAPYPLVIVSHGYPGNRYIMAHLTENLASKGYVVVAIGHTDSTFADQAAFASTLYNRPLDQLFVLDEMERFSAGDDGFLSGLVDAGTTAIVGYSMGGYGALNVIGAGYTEASTQFGYAPPNGVLAQHQAGTEAFEARQDPRVVAAITFAPWGMNAGFWDADGLAGIETPVLFMAGSVDDVAGYENGTRAIFEGAVNADRYLLTFENANHNAAAPIPAPRAAWETGTFFGDAVWDTVRMNNIAQHFATAFLGLHLKDDAEMASYLDLVDRAADGVWSVDDEGEVTADHSYWKGFQNRTAVGLTLEHGAP